MFEKIANILERVLVPLADKMNSNRYFSAIRDAFTILMPFIIIGSFGLLFNIYITSPTGLAKYESFAWLANYSKVFSTVNTATINFMGLWVVILVGYSLGETLKLKPLLASLIATTSFIMMTDLENLSSNLGASSLFTGFLISILSVEILNYLMKFEAIKIKLPDQVPPMIAQSFNVLIPAWITLSIFGLVAGTLYGAWGLYLNNIIYSIIQAPFNKIVGSQLGVSILVVVSQLLWWTGIHGTQATNAIADPIRNAALAANIAAVAAGSQASEVYTKAFMHLFMNLGGGGIVISLALAILVFSKKKEYKDITKIAFIPLVFGISEPMVFGLPIMLNPIFLVPFVLAPLITTNIGYFAINSGFLTSNYVESVSGLPMFLQQFLAYSGQWSALILVVVVVAVAFAIYTPFVLMSNTIESEVN